MNSNGVVAGLLAAGAEREADLAAQALRAVEARVSEQFAGSDVLVDRADDGSVRMRAKRLHARAFGSRSRVADPRFAGLMATLARGDFA